MDPTDDPGVLDPSHQPYAEITCPVSDCMGVMYMDWRSAMYITPGNTIADLANPANAHSTSWQIGCTEGHVLLLPVDHADDGVPFGWEHDPNDDDECRHDDIGRLRALLGITWGLSPA